MEPEAHVTTIDGTGLPQFRGTDAKECEEFIAAVVKHAYSQGKLRDDEWIADFAASCFVRDALRWWSWLDEQTQGSWKLLRQAMFTRYHPIFCGKNGEEAEQFVYSVRQRARDAGKQKDNDWIIAFISDSFVGNALRFHVSLDSSIQENWKLLQVAILAQYPREDQSGPLLKMPTPAAAPQKTKKRGRIRLLKRNDSTIYYVSKNSSSYGPQLTTSLAEALEVEYNPSLSGPYQLHIPDVQVPGYDTLGARWLSPNITLSGSHAYICGINQNGGGTSIDGTCSGPQMIDIWHISPMASDATQLLQISASNGTASLIIRTTSCIFLMPPAGVVNGGVDADLFFEPI